MADSTRDAIGEALAGKLTPEQLAFLMDEVLAITKGARGWCPNCKKQVQVEIPDAKAVTSSLAELMTQSWGRPNEQKQDTQIIVNRSVEYVCEHGHPCAECEKTGGAGGDHGDEVPAE